jgi:hypothetical protein
MMTPLNASEGQAPKQAKHNMNGMNSFGESHL